jgi:5-methylcytosine-specific restriction protein A
MTTPAQKWGAAVAQQFRCNVCRATLTEVSEVDHIRPLGSGGSHSQTNLQVLCPDCHARKSRNERRRGLYRRKSKSTIV